MRVKKTIPILLIFFGILSSHGQCKNLKERPLKSWRNALFLNPNIQIMTSLKGVQGLGGVNSKGSFFSDDKGGNYFLLSYHRDYMRNYGIQKGQELIFYFENGMAFTLYAFTNFPMWTSTIILPYFEISREQIEILAKHPIERIQLYYTDPNAPEEDTHFNIRRPLPLALIKPANCFLELIEADDQEL